MNSMNLADIYITLHSNTKEFNNFSTVHGTFSRTDHILGHNTSLNRYKKVEISCILSDHNELKLDTNISRNNKKYTNSWKYY